MAGPMVLLRFEGICLIHDFMGGAEGLQIPGYRAMRGQILKTKISWSVLCILGMQDQPH